MDFHDENLQADFFASDYERECKTCNMATMISTKCTNLFGDSQWSALLMAHMASQQPPQTPLAVQCTPMSKLSLWKF